MSETPKNPETDVTETPENNPADPNAAAGSLDEAVRQRDDYFDQLQRTRAEFLNYQKRARAQADADRQYAVGSLVADLLHVLDNFERATEAARAAGAESIVSGLDMVYKQFLDTLAKHGVEPIDALGQPFDPNLHEAMLQQPDPTQPEGTVVSQLSRGYRIHDRVLRPTKVAVSTRPSG